MAAGVHPAGVPAGVRESVEFLHRQRVHVGAQAHAAPAGAAVASLHDADDAGHSHAPVNGNAPFGQLLRHPLGGANFLKAQLGMGMQITAKGRHVGGVAGKGLDEVHGVGFHGRRQARGGKPTEMQADKESIFCASGR